MLSFYLIITCVVAVLCLCVSGIMMVDANEQDERVSRKFALAVVFSPLWPVAAAGGMLWLLRVFIRHLSVGFEETFKELRRN